MDFTLARLCTRLRRFFVFIHKDYTYAFVVKVYKHRYMFYFIYIDDDIGRILSINYI